MDGAPPPPKKKLSGCALAAIIVGAIVLAGIVAVVGGALWFFTRSEAGIALRDTMIEARGAQNAPGTAQMRAAGCTMASSFDMSRMANVGRTRAQDADTRAELERLAGVFTVFCVSPMLTCEEVAAAWGQGAPAHARSAMVSVVVGFGNPQPPRCSGHFDRSGAALPDAEVGPAEAPLDDTAK